MTFKCGCGYDVTYMGPGALTMCQWCGTVWVRHQANAVYGVSIASSMGQRISEDELEEFCDGAKIAPPEPPANCKFGGSQFTVFKKLWHRVRERLRFVENVLRVGDVMVMSVALVDQMQADPFHAGLRVRVKKIERFDDGTVKLWMENEHPRPIDFTGDAS